MSLSPHFASILLKAYLPQFLLLSTSCLLFSKNISGHAKKQETRFEETEEVAKPPELNIIGMLELSDQELKKKQNKTMNNVLRALIEKSIQYARIDR